MATQARLSLFMPKCHIVGNHMSQPMCAVHCASNRFMLNVFDIESPELKNNLNQLKLEAGASLVDYYFHLHIFTWICM